MTRRRPYTKEDLKRLHQDYDKNFKRLIAAENGSKDHKKYLAIENALDAKEMVIRGALGLIARDPCFLENKGAGKCENCTGYWITVNKKNRMSKNKAGTRCAIFEFSKGGKDGKMQARPE